MFRTLIFDLGKVIVPFELKRGYEALAKFCPYTPEEVRQGLMQSGLVAQLEAGGIEPEPFFHAISEKLQLTMGYPEFCEIWNSIFFPHTLIPENFLAQLSQRYRLILLSNTNAIHFEVIEKNYPLLRHFEHLVLSHRVRAVKPEPAIYREAVRLAECKPEECLFIDDMQENVDGAAREGLAAIRFESFAQLERDFLRLGIAGNGAGSNAPVTMKD